MPSNTMSHADETAFLAGAAHELTICARETYEAGTGNVLHPRLLREYNELLHRVTGALRNHVAGTKGYSIEAIIEMMHAFGARNNRAGAIAWVLKQIEREPLS